MAKSKKIKIGKIKKLEKKQLIIIGSVIGIILIAAGIFAATSLFKPEEKESKPNNEEKLETPPVVEDKKLQIVDVNSKSRPYAIMINNINVARPYQTGLQDAYIIYELIVEGGITRYLALFKDQVTTQIGTIRSSRHYYLDYALENDAIYVHWGWSPKAQSDISALKINNINGLYDNSFWKDNTLPVATEHRAYTSMEKLIETTNKKKYRTETNKDLLLNYSVDEINMADIPNATPAKNISIKYSNSITSSYVYDEENGYYLRSVNGKNHVDYKTGKQYHFKNIITYQVRNFALNDGENKGRQDINNVTNGTGYFISGGYSIPIKWDKPSREAQTKYYYEDGSELKVNDGNTFIQIQPSGQELNIS